jgi:hypothetical protein
VKLPKPVEELGQRLVEDVRDDHLNRAIDLLSGCPKFATDRLLYERLRAAGIGDAQFEVLRSLLVESADMLLGRLMAFVEHEVSQGNLSVTTRSAASGETYALDAYDMLATAYYSEDGLVQRHGRVRS